MPKAVLYNTEGVEIGDIDLQESVFGVPVHKQALHQAVVRHLAGLRRGTASTKTRAEVRGGGRKPWRQKGTGRARVGSIRSPIWRGGGIAFGPKPRSYTQALPRKMRQLVLKSALSSRAQSKNIYVLEDISLEQPKTKDICRLLAALGIDRSVLVVVSESQPNLQLAARNLPYVKVVQVNHLNSYDILAAEKMVVTKEALEKIRGVLADA